MAQYAVITAGAQIYGMSVGIKIIIFNLLLLFFFQVTAICRNDNPNTFDPFAVEVSIIIIKNVILQYFHCTSVFFKFLSSRSFVKSRRLWVHLLDIFRLVKQ